MFAFCLANLLTLLISVIRIIETRLICVGQTEVVRYVAATDFFVLIFSNLIVMIPATLLSGELYFKNHDSNDHGGYDDDEIDNDRHDRYLAGVEYSGIPSSESYSVNHLPIILCFSIIFIFYPMHYLISHLRRQDDIKKVTIPMNIDLIIHRSGEWVMLMLGESILSILIVDIHEDFYKTFYMGIISVVLLQFLHFKSQPHDADDHAMRKSRLRGLFFSFVISWYSVALIVVGVCYKMLLTEYSYEDNHDLNGRYLGGDSGGVSYTRDERRTRITNLFGGSLAIIFACLDLMNIAHNGLGESMQRCNCNKEGIRFKGIFFVIMPRIGIIAVTAMVSLYTTTPEYVASLGFVAIVTQVIIRLIGNYFFPKMKKIAHEYDVG